MSFNVNLPPSNPLQHVDVEIFKALFIKYTENFLKVL